MLHNNSAISISNVGRAANNRLQCVTDSMSCCKREGAGNWFFPGDGGGVPSLHLQPDTFGRDRGSAGTVNLHRVSNDVMMPTGQYCCVVPDATGVMQLACVNIGELYMSVYVH